MEFDTWFHMIGAVVTANLLTLWFVYSAWKVTKIERLGFKPKDAPWHVLLGMIVPLAIAGFTAYMVKV